jgi:hypothetical protein
MEFVMSVQTLTTKETQDNKQIKWILGYVDGYGAIHHKVIYIGDTVDSHFQIWPAAKHSKWRWMPNKPHHINVYGEELYPEDEDKIWNLIDKIIIL